MSMLLVQPLPPPVTVAQQPYISHSDHASIGPFIVVLVVIIILGLVAVMIGRLCTGKKIMGYEQYDIESWIETKCASCIDGRIIPPPERAADASSGDSLQASALPQAQQEVKQEEQSPQPAAANV